MDALLGFAATLVSLRLAGELVRRRRRTGRPELAWWAASLGAFAIASAALAWGAAAGWDDRAFRLYYLGGALLTAALLGAGSLVRVGRDWVVPIALVYTGLAAGVMIAEPLARPVSGTSVPDAQDYLDLFPARLLAIAGNSVGTLAAVAVALATLRRRPVGNTLLLAGIGVAALGSALGGLGAAGAALSLAAASVLLYAGFVVNR
jgi:hypothetical protein